MGAAILTFSSLFGFFGVGGYPIGLELAVEATYPVEQTISTAFIFLSGQLQGIVVIAVVGALSTQLKPEYEDIQVCSDNSDTVAKDYSGETILRACCWLVINSVIKNIFCKWSHVRSRCFTFTMHPVWMKTLQKSNITENSAEFEYKQYIEKE